MAWSRLPLISWSRSSCGVWFFGVDGMGERARACPALQKSRCQITKPRGDVGKRWEVKRRLACNLATFLNPETETSLCRLGPHRVSSVAASLHFKIQQRHKARNIGRKLVVRMADCDKREEIYGQYGYGSKERSTTLEMERSRNCPTNVAKRSNEVGDDPYPKRKGDLL